MVLYGYFLELLHNTGEIGGLVLVLLTCLSSLIGYCLFGGIGLALLQRNKGLMFFSIPFGLSELLAVSVILFDAKFSYQATERIMWIFSALQFTGVAFAIYKSQRNMISALGLTVINLAYLLYVSLFSSLSFTGSFP